MLAGGAAASAAIAAWLHRDGGPRGSGPAAALLPAQRSSVALGSQVSMLALHARQDVAQRGIDAAFAELAAVEQVMSIYRPDSQLAMLNRDGRLADPHPYLLEVLRKSHDLWQRSAGAFDVTVQPLWELYAAAQKRSAVPDADAVRLALPKVDWRHVAIDEREVRYKTPGMAITLNGIAQGYAADRALAALRSHGVEHAMVNTGELGTLGRKADGGDWTIGIQHPRQPDAYIAVAKLRGRCMATSGDYATAFTPDRAYNHIFDPATGRSPEELASATIVAPTGADADGLSTAVFVLGLSKGMELVRSLGVEAYLVTKAGRVVATEGFPTA